MLFNQHVAGTITAQGRDLIKHMDHVNQEYWYNMWHNDFELHNKLQISNISKIEKTENVSIYCDTDSIEKSSIIETNTGKYSIEDWFNFNIKNGSAGNTTEGHESVLTNDRILNYNNTKGIYYAKVKRIIRHKVSKPKFKLKTKSGKEILVTDDHSMVVFRDGIQIEIKPSKILKSDKVLILKNSIEYEFDKVESCELIGNFDNEYVYDIEVDDETHTFIANDILVHNSLFVSFDPIINKCAWKNI